MKLVKCININTKRIVFFMLVNNLFETLPFEKALPQWYFAYTTENDFSNIPQEQRSFFTITEAARYFKLEK